MDQSSLIRKLLIMRVTVGCLGEQTNPPWWGSLFCSKSSQAFLKPVFAKTSFMAQYHGLIRVASQVHDEHIGIGQRVFHLFRLPESFEYEMQNLLYETDFAQQLFTEIPDKERAIAILSESSIKPAKIMVGPVRIGDITDIGTIKNWNQVAGYYYNVFLTGDCVFPFFSEGTK